MWDLLQSVSLRERAVLEAQNFSLGARRNVPKLSQYPRCAKPGSAAASQPEALRSPLTRRGCGGVCGRERLCNQDPHFRPPSKKPWKIKKPVAVQYPNVQGRPKVPSQHPFQYGTESRSSRNRLHIHQRPVGTMAQHLAIRDRWLDRRRGKAIP